MGTDLASRPRRAPEKRRRRVAAMLAYVLMGSLLGMGHLVSTPRPAAAATNTVLINEPLTGGSNPLWQRVGTATGINYECWTAASATGATAPAIGKCPGVVNTYPDGQGSLRLEDTSLNAVGTAYHTVSLPTARAIEVGFDSYIWAGGSTPGSGITAMLAATNPTTPARPTTHGTNGGQLGYMTVPNTYLGFMLDVEGYTVRPENAWNSPTCAAPASTGSSSVNVPSSLTVRGPQGTRGNCLLSTVQVGAGSFNQPTNAVASRPATPNRVLFAINPTPNAVTLSNGATLAGGRYWFGLQNTYTAAPNTSTTGDLPSAALMSNAGIPAAWLDSTGRYPQRVMLGFTATSGNPSMSVKEIASVSAATVDSTPLPVWDLSVSAGSGGNLIAGNTSNVVSVTPTLSGGADPSSPTFTVTLPTGLTAPASFTSGSYTCTTSGQVVTCRYPGTIASPIPVGTLPTLSVPVTYTIAGSGTVTATAYSSQTQNNTTVSKTTTATWATQTPFLVPSPAVATQGADITYAISGLPSSATGKVDVVVAGVTVCTATLPATSCTSTTTPLGNNAATATWSGNSPLASQEFTPNTVTVRSGTILIGSALNNGSGAGWQRLGNVTYLECLTAASAPAGAAAPALPKCSTGANTFSDGQGALRLTDNGGVTGAAAYNMTSVAAGQPLEFSFDHYFYAGSNPPGSATTLILSIPDPKNPARPTVYGTGGGGLAYPGIPNTYLGFILAGEDGNATTGTGGATCRAVAGPTAPRGEILVEGPQNAGKGTCAFSRASVGNANWWQPNASNVRPATPVRVLAAINPTSSSVTLSNGVTLGANKYWFGVKDLYNGVSPVSTTGDLPTAAELSNVGVTSSYLDSTGRYPQRLMVGFGATGTGAYGIKEIANVGVSNFSTTSPEWSLTVSDSGGGTLIAGNGGNKILVTPTLAGAPDPSSPTFTVTLPTGLTAPASFTSGSYTCTTSGQVVTCRYPGTMAAPIPVGALATLEVPVTTTPGGSGTVTGTAYSSQAQANTTVTATATTTWATVTLTATPNPASAGQSITYAVSGLPSGGPGTVTVTDGATTLCSFSVATASSCVSTSTPVGTRTVTATWSGNAPYATQTWTQQVNVVAGRLLMSETFREAQVAIPANWQRVLSPSNTNSGCLQGGTNTSQTPFPGCDSSWAGGFPGDNALALNSMSTTAQWAVASHVPSYPTSSGLEVTYSTRMWSTNAGGGDHEYFRIFAANPAGADTLPSPNDRLYYNLALDVFGSSAQSDANFPMSASCPSRGLGTGVRAANSITVRGPGACWLGYQQGSEGWFAKRAGVGVTRPGPVKVTFAMNPTSSTLTLSDGRTLAAGKMIFGITGVYNGVEGQIIRDLPTAADISSLTTYPAGWTLSNGVPQRLRFDFAGWNGSVPMNKDIQDVRISTLSPAGPAAWSVALSDNVGHTFVAGNTGTQTVTLTPTLAGSPDPSSPTFSVTLPTGLTPPAWSNTTVGGYTCSTSAQVVTCTYPSSQASPIPVGDLPALDIPVTVPGTATAGSRTISATVSSAQTETIGTTSTSLSVTVTKLAATASPASFTFGTSTTLAMTGVPSTATGTVTFSAGGVTLCTATLPATSCTSTLVPVGNPTTITATWSDNTPYATQSVTTTATVTKATPTVTANALPASVAVGNAVTLSLAGLTPGATGTVTFTAGGSTLCTATLPATSCQTSTSLARGTYAVTAAYSGDANVNAVTATTSFTITSPAPVLTLAVSPASVAFGTTATLSVTGMPADATGTVTFSDPVHGTLCTATLPATSCSTSATLPAGSYTVSATYPGDADYAATTTTSLPLSVTKASPTMTASATPAQVPFGTAATLAVSGLPTGATGVVTFTDGGGATLCTATLPATSCTTSTTLALGTYAVTVAYPGDANVNAASATTSFDVVRAATTITAGANPDPAAYGTPVTLSVTGLPTAATGTVIFTDTATGATLCTATLSTIQCTSTVNLPTGSHTVQAAYSGDTNHLPSTATTSLTVTKATVTMTAAANPTSVAFGTAVTVSVTGIPTGATGTVTFADGGGATLCTATLPTLSCATPVTHPVGSVAVTATYSGDADHSAATATTGYTITKATPALTASATPTSTPPGSAVTLSVAGLPQGATGSVGFTDGGGTTLCTATLPAVSCQTSTTLAEATYAVTATYPGDGNVNGATATTSFVVGKLAFSITGAATPGSVIYPAVSRLSVTGVPGDATGPVTFTDAGGAVLCTMSQAVAGFCSTSPSLAAGTYQVTARYAGDGRYLPTTSAPFTLVVTPRPTAVTVTVSPATIAYGATATLTAGGLPAGATGTVQFTDGSGAVLCSVDVAVGLSCATPATLPVGSYAVTAAYLGDGNNDPSTSTSKPLTVGRAPVAVTAAATPAMTPYGTTSTLSASGIPTGASGTVTFTTSAGADLCIATLPATSCATSATLAAGAYQVTARYSGDANHAAATSSAVTLTITTATATLAVSVTPATISFGSVATVAVTGIPSGATGTVSFTLASSGAVLCTATLPVTSCSTPATLPAGTHDIAAAYSGDANYTATTSATSAALTVTRATTSLTATAFLPTIAYGESAALTVSGLPAEATGTVTFRAGGNVLCALTLPATSCPTATTLPAGAYSVTATYNGDLNHAPATSPAVTLTVNPAATLVTISVSPATVPHGSTAVVTVAGIPADATGNVVVRDTSTGIDLCTIALPAHSCTTPETLTVGDHPITATYAGDGNHAAATSAPATLTVTVVPTTLVGSASPASIPFGMFTTLTATGIGSGATGTVTFAAGGATLCTATLPDPTCQTATTLAAGTYSVVATYPGDPTHAPGTSAAFSVTVAPAATQFTMAATPATFSYGRATDLEQSGLPSGATGTVIFTDTTTGTTLCSLVLPDASCTSPANLAVGSHAVTAAYSGDGNHAASTAGPVTVTVTRATATVTATLEAPSTAYGTPITVSATGLPAGATGTITVRDSATGAVLCTATLPAGCLTPATLAVGDHPVTVTYSGDGTYLGATSPPAILTVTKLATNPGVTVSPASIGYGGQATVTVTGLPAGATGTVTATDATTGAVLCTLTAPATTCTTPTSLTPGTYAVQVAYAGNGTYAPGTSGTAPLLVTRTTPTVTVTATASSFPYGGTTTFTASGLPPGATGTVTFVDELGAVVCTATLPTTRCTGGSALTGGAHQITASYSGDANTAPAASASIPVTVIPATITPAPTVSASPSSVPAGGTTTLTIGGLPPNATGTVTVTDPSGATVCTIVLPGTTCSVTTTLPVGTHTLTAAYPGDGNYAPATAATPLTVTGLPVAVTLTTGGSTTYRDGATLNAGGLPSDATGTLTFRDTSTGAVLCTATLPATSCPIPIALPAGSHPVTVTYSGDGRYAGATVGPVPFTVDRADPRDVSGQDLLGAVSGAVRVPYGTPVTLTYSGLPADATGTVTFYGSILCTATVPARSCQTSPTLPVGVERAHGEYSGDRNYLPVNTPVFTFEIYRTATSITTPATPPTSKADGTTTFTITPPDPTATGTVDVIVGGRLVCTITLPATSCTVRLNLPPGEYAVEYRYSGDQNHAPSTTRGSVTVADRDLPITGGDPLPVLNLAILLILLGTALLRAARTRARTVGARTRAGTGAGGTSRQNRPIGRN